MPCVSELPSIATTSKALNQVSPVLRGCGGYTMMSKRALNVKPVGFTAVAVIVNCSSSPT
ncbi:hypothetical protein [Sphaerobacter sp.]|uniref:hypothetical protein n=1 Tax=Sphaerobacter sp. TaxID=2099654 RepID=UPI001D57CD35|nr:hypothetical protein [Sphaerobacter sp.]MBX5445518.1 hypothetical protein [Sphaerobacter sp.]